VSAARETAVRRLIRRPGLFRRWELKDALGIRSEVHFEEDGKMADGTVLWAIYDVKEAERTKASPPPATDWVPLPGAYRASEFKLPDGSGDWRLEDIGRDSQGETLYRLHHRLERVAAPLRGAA
jgi:hypothetical protein